VRTTLDIDADVLEAAKEISARSKRTAGQVLSDLARRALSSPAAVGIGSQVENGFETIPAEGRVVTAELVRRLAEESE
jgi:hypothetical protein